MNSIANLITLERRGAVGLTSRIWRDNGTTEKTVEQEQGL
jgi:hypothetical protein